MKKHFPFLINGSINFADLLDYGLQGFAVFTEGVQHGHTSFCILSKNAIIKIQSEMNDIDGWHEIGCLEFSAVEEIDVRMKIVPLDESWTRITSLEKLCHDSENCYAESGIRITNDQGMELTIVCDANPYVLSIKAPFFDDEFLPEYELISYKRIAL
ncbi:hypothetical protein RF679_18220 [Undibacterium cyanobacteriorum]|uniref:Uncharacterized protein n=1 Tax=Undibacterium cyanobacteriorum TaxID=3073561 RepID=A0ABY9RH50_9BURK|nr:hypothetical protein [Undibacterium sp. 20NA77.5]WMW80553.1 hypothetical protein RF679_18220 [Undibacterium sp. 20NA77.5]